MQLYGGRLLKYWILHHQFIKIILYLRYLQIQVYIVNLAYLRNLYYTPQVLEPTVVYHQVINNLLAKLDISIVDKKVSL